MAAPIVNGGAALQATVDHAVYCFDALVFHLSGGEQALDKPKFEEVVCPLFVTWNKVFGHGDYRLRGCIGTFDPHPLYQGLKEYSITSALRDRRFTPISLSELPLLRCTVSLLHSFERGSTWDDWDVGVHGVTIEFTDPVTGSRRSATFLPEIAAHEGWDKQTTMEHLVRKAGCAASSIDRILHNIRVTRYQSTVYSLSYEEYMGLKDPKLYRLSKVEKRGGEEALRVPA